MIATCAAHHFATPASYAQQRLDEVLVTASRFPERREGAPVGMRIIDASEIAASQAIGLPELLSRTGVLHIRNQTGTPDSQLDLRGFGATSDQNTLVLLDGVRINEFDGSSTRLSAIPLNAIERIEIVPGGGAVQYGGGATGGMINIVTRAPERGDRSGSASAGVASYQTADYRVTSRFAGERIGLSLAANALDTENYRRNNAVSQQNLLGDVRLLGEGPAIGLKFGLDRQNARFPGGLSEAAIQSDPRATPRPNDYGRIDGAFATINGGTKLGNLDLLADLAWRDSATRGFFDGFGTFSFNESKLHSLAFSPRLRWSMQAGEVAHSVVAGLDLSDRHWDRRAAPSASGLAAPAAHQDARQQGQGMYLQYRTTLPSRTQIHGGVRTERVDDELRTDVTATSQRRIRSLNAVELGVQQGLSEQVSIYLKGGTSYRLPHVFENNGDQLLEPQKARSYEAGIEHRAGEYSIRFAAYLIRLTKEIYFSPLTPDPIFGFPGANTNLSPTERRGLEWSGEWRPVRDLSLGASLNLQRATFRSGVYGGVDVSGKDVPLVPQTLATFRAAWTVFPKTRLSGSYVHVGSQRFDGDQDNAFARTMPKYDIVDLGLSHEAGAWLLATGVRNLFDRRYFSYGIVFTGATTYFAYPQAGRTAFASAEYRFR